MPFRQAPSRCAPPALLTRLSTPATLLARFSTSRPHSRAAVRGPSSSCACARPSKRSTWLSTPTSQLSTASPAGQSWKRRTSGTAARKRRRPRRRQQQQRPRRRLAVPPQSALSARGFRGGGRWEGRHLRRRQLQQHRWEKRRALRRGFSSSGGGSSGRRRRLGGRRLAGGRPRRCRSLIRCGFLPEGRCVLCFVVVWQRLVGNLGDAVIIVCRCWCVGMSDAVGS